MRSLHCINTSCTVTPLFAVPRRIDSDNSSYHWRMFDKTPFMDHCVLRNVSTLDALLLHQCNSISKLLPIDVDIPKLKSVIHDAVDTIGACIQFGGPMGVLVLSSGSGRGAYLRPGTRSLQPEYLNATVHLGQPRVNFNPLPVISFIYPRSSDSSSGAFTPLNLAMVAMSQSKSRTASPTKRPKDHKTN